jgi:hypothetical protein
MDIDKHFSNKNGIEPKWLPYFYDVAFQTQVLEWALPSLAGGALSSYRIQPRILLVNKDVTCDVDGLHQRFRVSRSKGDSRSVDVLVASGTTRKDLGSLDMLIVIDLHAIVEQLKTSPIKGDHLPEEARTDLVTFMHWAAKVQQAEKRFFTRPDNRCKKCSFRAAEGDPLRSGVHECWSNAIAEGWLKGDQADALQRTTPLTIDLNARSSHGLISDIMKEGYAFIKDIPTLMIKPANHRWNFNLNKRRRIQIELERDNNESYQLHREYLTECINSWEAPFHMIDFETTTPAIPFSKGMRPYQTIAFQFSHHIMEPDHEGGFRIRHANQYVSTDPHTHPNLSFVRELRKALMPEGKLKGTVFMYTGHERTVLQQIGAELRGRHDLSDYEELMQFIQLLAGVDTSRNNFEYSRRLRDLHDLVLKSYVSRQAGGSTSLKYILPAVLKDAPKTASRYSSPGFYGAGLEIPSLNFADPDGHVWLKESSMGNPYRSLPSIFGGLDESMTGLDTSNADIVDDGFSIDDDVIDNGGMAMAAYNYTQYVELSSTQRERIRQSLLRYCELDTLAMCMLVEGLVELAGGGFQNTLITKSL